MHREMKAKVDKLRGLMREKGWEGIILNRVENFTWLTCGHYAHVGLGSEFSVATIVIKAESLLLIADEMSVTASLMRRFRAKILNVFPWHGLTTGTAILAPILGVPFMART